MRPLLARSISLDSTLSLFFCLILQPFLLLIHLRTTYTSSAAEISWIACHYCLNYPRPESCLTHAWNPCLAPETWKEAAWADSVLTFDSSSYSMGYGNAANQFKLLWFWWRQVREKRENLVIQRHLFNKKLESFAPYYSQFLLLAEKTTHFSGLKKICETRKLEFIHE